MQYINQLFNFLSIELTVILTAILPVIELKGAIPVGISFGLSPLHAFILGFLGSVIPVPFILLTIRPIFNRLKKTRVFVRIIDGLTVNSMAKSGRIQKYGLWGLFIFVAIPLPGTGVWTGSLIAAMLDIRIKRAFPTILAGNLIAGAIIMGLADGILRISINGL